MTRLPRIAAVLFLGATMAASNVVADEFCEVAAPDGAISLVPCCTITPDGAGQSEECAAVADALDAAKEIETLEGVIAQHALRRTARFLRANPTVSFGAFTIERPPISINPYCCTCVPGETCTTPSIVAVCDLPNSDGTCPAGTLRVLCLGRNDCKSID